MFDFKPHCAPCLWCCHGERVFTSREEQESLGEDRFRGVGDENAPCEKLDISTGLCSVHPRRPLECRLFPLDLLRIEGAVKWVVWGGACPAVPHMKEDLLMREVFRWEQELDPSWVQAYVEHHLKNQPAKYQAGMYSVLKEYTPA